MISNAMTRHRGPQQDCRSTMKRPFDIVFEEFDDHIVIYAVAHTKRKPGYWRERLNDNVR